MKHVNLGLDDSQRDGSIVLLNRVLATESIMLIKTKKLSWDIVGPQFMPLHDLWNKQHREMSSYAEQLAERVRMLGGYPIGTAAGFLEHSTVEEQPGDVTCANDAVARLVDDHELLVRILRSYARKCIDDYNDIGTHEILTTVLKAHERMSWMLRSFLEGERITPDGQVVHGSVPNLA